MAGGRTVTGGSTDFWTLASFALHLVGAIVCAIAAVWVLHRGDADRPDGGASVAALGLTALSCGLIAALGPAAPVTNIAESVRNLAWIFVLYRLFVADGRDRAVAPIRPVVAALVFVEIMQTLLLLFDLRSANASEMAELAFEVSTTLRILVAIGALVLLHNFYGGASSAARKAYRWAAAGLAMLWLYELNFQTTAYLTGDLPAELSALRGIVFAALAILVAIGASQAGGTLMLRPSRKVTFQTLSLLLIGGYLAIMVLISESIALQRGELARFTQVAFVFAASVFAILWLPSKRLRGWLRVTMVKHLFQHRYDYRAEWLRFTQTLGQGGENSHSLHERVVQALADITDSPSGLLLLPNEQGAYELASRWQWRDIDVPAEAMSGRMASLLESGSFVVDLDEVRQGANRYGEAPLLPEWLAEEQDAWALVPLLHFDRLTGVVVLSRPLSPRNLDWEDFDLLRVVGQQLASYIAEQAGQHALMESARFEEFNRRIAFVMHDIKNLASQLTLLARNAQRHADNPEFRADMLVTLRNSADKLNSLLARLGRYGGHGSDRREPFELAKIVKAVAEQYGKLHPVQLIHADSCKVLADPEALEQALIHLVQNAVDASDERFPVMLDVSSDGVLGRVDVIDSGCGMSPEFVRNGLFKPFVSSKNAGFGIGAFEARELVTAMGGRLDVESRVGLGTRFAIQLPLAAAADLLARTEARAQNDPTTEVA
ncbi:XrtA/PEP-CTERM system histidine kinase PrsK [Allopontixanthobacter sp.]|uniref:XrtA/PEP-CTERM system histidine kinase PrsK n=1 Tax=Allopontixanthobacter sp. TaxID=2906452 RepID=UPI002AB98697|nr:XrtA/PEP-CTERM system histidine kinase PrsK [Allopontixanthobacter sp.]MDZ4307747.1 XrtA/PEP-CTERM system histidine kinase PrsK [Allopontixanthobacter sp.]